MNPSFGSGSTTLGGGSAVAQALARRGGVGGSGGMQSQVSPSSQIYDPNQQVQPPTPLPNGSPMSNLPQQAFTQQSQVQDPAQQMIAQAQAPQSQGGTAVTKTEAEKIVDALTGHLKHIQKKDMLDRGMA